MNAQPGKVARRRRRQPQRVVPAVVEQRQPTPFIFGWGANLTQHQRDSLKERIALFAGIAIAAVIIAILAWGAIYDNVIKPANQRAANDKPVAIIGKYTITTGFFKRFEQLQSTNVTTQLTQAQSQLAQAQALPKGSPQASAQIQQLQLQVQQLQAAQTNLAANTLNAAVDAQIAIQRGYTAGVPDTARAQKAAIDAQIKASGGPIHFQQFIANSGLSADEIKMLLVGDYLQSKIRPKIYATAPRTQLQVRASHILVAATKLALARKLFAEVKSGANFAQLAKKYSTDSSSAVKGGDLGFFPRGRMVKPFEQAAFSMKVGEIRLVKSQFGWHIIKLTARQNRKISGTDYQTAQASAYAAWISKQKQALGYQPIVAPSDLPVVATPTANALGNLPTQPVQQPALPATVQPTTAVKTHATKTAGKP